MPGQVVLIHSGLKRDVTVTDAQARAMLAGQKRSAEKRQHAGSPAVAGEWKVKKAGDA